MTPIVAARRPSAGKIAALGEQWNVGRMVKSLAGAIVRQARLGKEINQDGGKLAGQRGKPSQARAKEEARDGRGWRRLDGCRR